jgi:hypothetical protein
MKRFLFLALVIVAILGASAWSEEPAPLIRHRILPVTRGGTGADTAAGVLTGLGAAALAGGNAFTGNQSITSGEVRIATTTDMGTSVLQVVGNGTFQHLTDNCLLQVYAAANDSAAFIEFLNDQGDMVYFGVEGSNMVAGEFGGDHAYLNLDSGNAFGIKQSSAVPLYVNTGGEVVIASTTDLGSYEFQVHGDAVFQENSGDTNVQVKNASSTGYGILQFFNDTSSAAYISKNGSTYSADSGADGLSIYNSASKPIHFYQGSTGTLKLTADNALQLPQIATPTLATGVLFFSSHDASLQFSRDGAAWTQIAP